MSAYMKAIDKLQGTALFLLENKIPAPTIHYKQECTM